MIIDLQTEPKLVEIARSYFVNKSNGKEDEYFRERMGKIEEEFKTENIELKQEAVRECLFFDLMGYDLSSTNFGVLDVMAMNDFSSKKIAYLTASQIWHPESDVVIMATNRIQRDLISVNPYFADFALSSFSRYLTRDLAQVVAPDVIALMSSNKVHVAQKAIITFYHVCLHFSEALKAGFSILRSRLKDTNQSIVFTTLTVMTELASHNAKNFTALIPKFHKMITKTTNNWIILRLLSLLKMLVVVEPRLEKKLSFPLKTVIETTTSASVIFECVRLMVDANVQDADLFEVATLKIESYLEHPEPNLRYLCMQTFVKLIKVQPILVARHRELISNTLNSPDEPTRLIALELLCSLATEKTIDKIVGNMYDQYKNEKTSLNFKDQLFTKVINICSADNYKLVSDFDWYVSVIFDFIKLGTFTNYDLVARQLLDLAVRVPSTRSSLVEECSGIFPMSCFRDATALLLACSHIVGEYSENGYFVKKIFQPVITNYSERVQASCVDTAFKLYLKSEDENEAKSIESLFDLRLPLFSNSNYPEVSDRATAITELVKILKEQRNSSMFKEIKESLTQEEIEVKEVKRPAFIDEQIDLFDVPEEPDYIREAPPKIEEQVIEDTTSAAPKEEAKPKTVFRKQKLKRENKVEILDAASLLESKKSKTKKTGILSAGLASIDLTNEEEPAPQEEKEEQIVEEKENNETNVENETNEENKNKIKIKRTHKNKEEEQEILVIKEETPKKRRRHHHHHDDEEKENV